MSKEHDEEYVPYDNTLPPMPPAWTAAIEGDGAHCPCCHRWGKVYRRGLNASMARALMWLVHQEARSDGWIHVPSGAPPWLLRSQQLPTLRLWDLVEGFSTGGSQLQSSGLWKPTQLGVAFANNRATVQKYVYVYNNAVRDTEGDQIFIGDALGSKYNYEEIMANYDGTAPGFEEREED